MKIAVIGAGLSGLTLSHKLSHAADVVVFEKSRAPGGRLATRKHGIFHFDHGTQFFKMRTRTFKDFMAPLISEGIVQPWHARFVEIDRGKITAKRQWQDEPPHYVGVPNMRIICEYLAKDQNILYDTTVTNIYKEDKWHIIDSSGKTHGPFDWVISTCPAEQAKALMPKDFSHMHALEAIKMQACFSLMVGFRAPLELTYDAALIKGADISWLSVNSSKPERDKPSCLLVHATNKWADAHFEQDREITQQYLCAQTISNTGIDISHADHIDLHGWRYANIKKQTLRSLVDLTHKLAACGDWCIQGRVEAAYQSAADTADHILNNHGA